jgi:hypothetical protein
MMTKYCSVIEDLLPLYNEGLLQEETIDYVESHLNSCADCAELGILSAEPVIEETLSSPINQEKMMSKITFRLSLYQIIFVSISFLLAIRTTLLNDSFGFILSYTVLGLLTYLFYKNIKIVIAITFLPVFLWSIGTAVAETNFDYIYGSLIVAGLHLLFALIGAIIAWLVLQLKGNEVRL